jgi:hypothetical protein
MPKQDMIAVLNAKLDGILKQLDSLAEGERGAYK